MATILLIFYIGGVNLSHGVYTPLKGVCIKATYIRVGVNLSQGGLYPLGGLHKSVVPIFVNPSAIDKLGKIGKIACILCYVLFCRATVLLIIGLDVRLECRAINGSSRSAMVHPSAFVPNGPRLVVVATLG